MVPRPREKGLGEIRRRYLGARRDAFPSRGHAVIAAFAGLTVAQLLEGGIHIDIVRTGIAEALDDFGEFIPMTDVQVSPPTGDGVASLRFVAVNKNLLAGIAEV